MGELKVGETIDRYRVEELLGHGGMGEVYRAYDPKLRRYVALKLLREPSSSAPDGDAATVADESRTISARAAARMLREARAAAALRHPNVVTVFDVGEVGGEPFIAMELLDGVPLRGYLGKDRVSTDRKLRWLAEVASALAAAHRSGLVHRDVKPDNVLVCSDDRVKVLDFGVVKVADSAPGDEGSRVTEPPPSSLPGSLRTGVGRRVGTLRYMAPEQAAAEAVDGRADQFAWGLTAYELLTGEHPGDLAPGFSAMCGWLEGAPSLDDRVPELPAAARRAVMRALEPLPQDRFPSMDALLEVFGSAVPSASSAAFPSGRAAASAPPARSPTATSTVEQGPAPTAPVWFDAGQPALPPPPAASPAVRSTRRRRAVAGAAITAALVGTSLGAYWVARCPTQDAVASTTVAAAATSFSRAESSFPLVAPGPTSSAPATSPSTSPSAPASAAPTVAEVRPQPPRGGPVARPPSADSRGAAPKPRPRLRMMVAAFPGIACPVDRSREVDSVIRGAIDEVAACFADVDVRSPLGVAGVQFGIQVDGRSSVTVSTRSATVSQCLLALFRGIQFSAAPRLDPTLPLRANTCGASIHADEAK